MVLVCAVAKAIPDVPVIASGRIADGAGLAAGLALGADGAPLGARFPLCMEASVHRVPGRGVRGRAHRSVVTSRGANTNSRRVRPQNSSRSSRGGAAADRSGDG